MDAADILRIVTQLGNSTAFADEAISQVQAKRVYEILKLTTPNRQTKSPTLRPTPRPQSHRPTFNLRPSQKPVARPTPVLTLKPADKPNDLTKTSMPTLSLTKPVENNQTKTLMPTPSLTKPVENNQTKTIMPTPSLTKPVENNQTKTIMPTPSMTKPVENNQTKTLMPTPSVIARPSNKPTVKPEFNKTQ